MKGSRSIPGTNSSASNLRVSYFQPDENTRRFALASLTCDVLPRIGAKLKAEYQWLDYDLHRTAYSSSQDYSLARSVLELAPQLTGW